MAILVRTTWKEFGAHMRAADAMLDAQFMLATSGVLRRVTPPAPVEHTGVIAAHLRGPLSPAYKSWPQGGGLCIMMGQASTDVYKGWLVASQAVARDEVPEDSVQARSARAIISPTTLEANHGAINALFERSDVIFFQIGH